VVEEGAGSHRIRFIEIAQANYEPQS
jgi:hypothetical protein